LPYIVSLQFVVASTGRTPIRESSTKASAAGIVIYSGLEMEVGSPEIALEGVTAQRLEALVGRALERLNGLLATRQLARVTLRT
jgi:hypothetical protein